MRITIGELRELLAPSEPGPEDVRLRSRIRSQKKLIHDMQKEMDDLRRDVAGLSRCADILREEWMQLRNATGSAGGTMLIKLLGAASEYLRVTRHLAHPENEELHILDRVAMEAKGLLESQ